MAVENNNTLPENEETYPTRNGVFRNIIIPLKCEELGRGHGDSYQEDSQIKSNPLRLVGGFNPFE